MFICVFLCSPSVGYVKYIDRKTRNDNHMIEIILNRNIVRATLFKKWAKKFVLYPMIVRFAGQSKDFYG